jgi:lipopolysaccharide/colanic/teichoic acid biosynthesis glycosyltransferase
MERHKFRVLTTLADLIILALSFLLVVWYKPASLKYVLPSHVPFFLSLLIIWIIVSLFNGKMHRGKIRDYTSLFVRVLTSNIIALSLTAFIMYVVRDYAYSRTIVLGTGILATLLEIFSGALFIAYKKAKLQNYEEYEYSGEEKLSEYEMVQGANGHNQHSDNAEVNPRIRKTIEEEVGQEITKAILDMTSHKITERTAVLSTTTLFNIAGLAQEKYDYIINLHKINDIKKLDDFLDAVNEKLELKGFFFCCVETKDQRKKRLLKKYPPVLNYILYFFDFIIKRLLPKLRWTRGIYFFLTRGENTVLSRAEALGRISRAGFKIRQESFIGNFLCIEAIKAGSPIQNKNINYGALIALPRVGKDGKIIKVYKLRTMHPYSEYIQDYVYKLHDLQNGGKFKHDFRITSWGKICRKIWIDELPMIINFLKGEMKLFGVRPLSRQYFDLYRPEVRERRTKYKPGLIPPFYADMPENLEEIQASEIRYLNSYDKNPLQTDFRYILKSSWNIIIRTARSK